MVHTLKTLPTEVAESNCRKTGVKVDQLEKLCDMLENDMSLKIRNDKFKNLNAIVLNTLGVTEMPRDKYSLLNSAMSVM